MYINYFFNKKTNKCYIVSKHKSIKRAIRFKALNLRLEDMIARTVDLDYLFFKTIRQSDMTEIPYQFERLKISHLCNIKR